MDGSCRKEPEECGAESQGGHGETVAGREPVTAPGDGVVPGTSASCEGSPGTLMPAPGAAGHLSLPCFTDGTPRVAGKSKCCNLSETTTAAGAETTRGFRLHDRHRFSSLTSASQDPSDSRTSGAGNGPRTPHGTPGDTERSLHLAILDVSYVW